MICNSTSREIAELFHRVIIGPAAESSTVAFDYITYIRRLRETDEVTTELSASELYIYISIFFVSLHNCVPYSVMHAAWCVLEMDYNRLTIPYIQKYKHFYN